MTANAIIQEKLGYPRSIVNNAEERHKTPDYHDFMRSTMKERDMQSMGKPL